MKTHPDNKELLKIINEIEDQFDLSKLNVRNINIWPLVRISICFGLIANRYNVGTFVNEKKGKTILSLISDIISLKKFLSKKPKINTLHTTHNLYLFNINNKIYDRVHFGNEFTEIQNNSKIKRINFSDFSINYIDNNKSITNLSSIFLFYKIISVPYSLFIFFGNFITFINLFYFYRFLKKKHISAINILFKIPFKVSYIFLISGFMKYFFKKCEIKLLRHANYYSLDSMAMTLAARRCNIEIENIQHGSQSKDHPAFGRWNAAQKDGYDLLPSMFSCWDKESVTILKQSFGSSAKQSVRLSKYSWVDAWKNNEIQYNFDEIKFFSRGKFNILLTLQPSIEGIQDFVLDTIKETSDDVCWWIRLHPRQLTKQTITYIKNSLPQTTSKISVDLASESPLPAILSVTDLHITAFSSSVYEASLFNVPSLITHKMGIDYYGQNLKNLNASYCNNCDLILENIKNGVKSKF